MPDPVIVWRKELKEAGWIEESSTTYRSPAGNLYRGPFRAWQVMKEQLREKPFKAAPLKPYFEPLSPIDEARRYCILSGWHENGNTDVTSANGGFLNLPEVLVTYTEQIAGERDRYRELAREAISMALPKPVIVNSDQSWCKCPYAKDQSQEWHIAGSGGCRPVTAKNLK